MIRIVVTMSVLALATSAIGDEIARRVKAGEMLGATFYWEAREQTFDTLRWNDAEKDLEVKDKGARGVIQSCRPLAAVGKQAFRLKNLTALSLVILKDLGFEIYFLTQWGGTTKNEIKVAVPGIDDQYKRHSILSDFLWERLDRYEIEKPTTMEPSYTVRVYFSNHGYGTYSGKEKLRTNRVQILGVSDGLVLEFASGDSYEDVTVGRLVHDAYLITDTDLTVKKIIRQVEKTMDKLELDLSYKPPELVPVTCESEEE